MPEPLWKKVQRKHKERMGNQGRCSYRYEDGPDSVPLPWLVVESKSVKELPKWLTEAVEMIEGQATLTYGELRHLNEDIYIDCPETDRLGVVRYHVTGTKYDDDVVVMRGKDFEEWFL